MAIFHRALDRSRTPIQKLWRTACSAGVDLLLPPGCTFCQTDIASDVDAIQLCETCRKDLINLRQPVCLQCGCEMPTSFTENQPNCSNCFDLNFSFSSVVSLGAYRQRTRLAVLQTKRLGGQPLAAAIGQLLLDCRRDRLHQFAPDLVAPIPMHWTRRLRRGTNCPDTVAERVAGGLRASAATHLLARRRKTIRQTDLPQGSRLSNVRRVFRIASRPAVRGKRVLLIDDIMTTGATCNEAAKALLTAGASDVAVAVIARATPWT